MRNMSHDFGQNTGHRIPRQPADNMGIERYAKVKSIEMHLIAETAHKSNFLQRKIITNEQMRHVMV
jgi:hypothetical protein